MQRRSTHKRLNPFSVWTTSANKEVYNIGDKTPSIGFVNVDQISGHQHDQIIVTVRYDNSFGLENSSKALLTIYNKEKNVTYEKIVSYTRVLSSFL